MRTTSALIALGAVVQQAAATHGGYDWLKAVPYSCPSNTDNQCSTEQSGGYKWQNLNPGPFHQYDNMQYKGFQCKNSFGKRDLTSRTNGFQDKCIAASAGKTHESNPVISCQDKGFSVDEMHVTTEEPQDLEFTYGYENGATCKHVQPCSSGGTIVKNSQCGGAKSVTVGLPPSAPKESCSFAIHSVGFNCGSASVPVPSSTIVPVVSSHTFPVYSFTIPNNQTTPTGPATAPTVPVSVPTGTAPYQTYPAHTPSVPSGTAPYPTTYPANTRSVPIGTAPVSSPSVPVTTPNSPTEASSVPSVSSPSVPASSPSVPATYPVTTPNSPTQVSSVPVVSSPSVPATYPVTTPNSPTEVSSVPVVSTPVVSSSVPGTTVPVYTTEIVVTTETTCPVTSTITSGSITSTQVITTVSTITSTSTSTVCTKCVPHPVSTPVESGTPSSPATPVVSVPVNSGTENSPTPATTVPVAPGTTAYTTEIETTYVTTCPVTNTITTGGSTSYETTTTVSTATSTYTSTVIHQGTPVAPVPTPASTPNSPAQVPSSPAQPSAPCPTVLPQCMNTWIKLTTCENNAASDCYCQDSSFTNSVQSCVSAWAADDKEVQAALSYLAGICAPHVSANPGIITNVPKTITLVPTPAAPSSPAGASGVENGATAQPATTSTSYTTISVSKTVTVPVTYTSGVSSGQAIPSSYITSLLQTSAVVPAAHFTTANSPAGSNSQPSVGLAAGTPAAAPANPTGAANGAVPAGYGPTGASTFASSGKPVNTATSSPIAPFKGAAVKVGSGMAGVVVAGLMGLIALV